MSPVQPSFKKSSHDTNSIYKLKEIFFKTGCNYRRSKHVSYCVDGLFQVAVLI